ncbi:MAG: hypothetical protein WC530_09575 [Candidatus Omnitrophota bacterium]
MPIVDEQIEGIDDGKMSLANIAKETKLTVGEDILSRDQVLSIRARTPRTMNVNKDGKIVTVPIVKKVKIGGGKETDYVPNPYYIRKANYTFGYAGWSFDIIAKELIENQAIVHGVLTAYVKGREIRKSSFGGHAAAKELVAFECDGVRLDRWTFYKKVPKDEQDKWTKIYGGYVDLGNTFKAAATDCFKKCMSMFGFFSDIYAPDDFVEVPPEVDGEKELETIQKMIATADVKALKEILKKIQKSDKYNEAQKGLIVELIDERMKRLPDGEPVK